MLYAMISTDAIGSLRRRMTSRALHEARIKALEQEGRLYLTGVFPAAESEGGAGRAGFVGNLIIAEFDNLKQARNWCDADPYWEAGVYASVNVFPFTRALASSLLRSDIS